MSQIFGNCNPEYWEFGVINPAALRLREERERLGYNQAAFGQLGGVSKNTQLAYESGTSSFTIEYLQKLAAFSVDIGYIFNAIRTISVDGVDPNGDKDDIVYVAEIDLRFGLGSSLMDEEITDQQAVKRSFPREWLRYITNSPPSALYWARGQGNSMEPTIRDGDVILIDRSQLTPSFGDLYWAIAYGQTGMIKRLRPMPDGSVKILSDNNNVAAETAYDGELHIFGRVVAVVNRI